MPERPLYQDETPAQRALIRFKLECASADGEANGINADKILDELLRAVGMPEVADAYLETHCWRS